MSESYDLVVVGGGSAGLTAARMAARLGARAVLVERDRLGGDCLWTGCVPSKALLHVAAEVHAARRVDRYGLGAVQGPVDLAAVMVSVRRAIAAIEPHDSAEALAALGVDVAHGEARFAGPRTLDAGGRRIRFRYAVIATGSAPALPPVPGLAEAVPLTSDSVWTLEQLPRRLVVLGGGPIGCELGQAFARLGSRVTIVEALDRPLPREEPHASELIRRQLADEGVTVLTGLRAEKVRGGALHHAGGALPFDQLLVTTGRTPDTASLAPEAAAGVALEHGQVRVDDRLRTTNPRIYAAGDVTGRSAFTHLAGVQAASVVTHVLLGVRRRIDYRAVPWVTFTDPEVARVGLTANEAHQAFGARTRVRTLEHDRVDRAVADDRADGFTRLVLDPRGRIVGATVVAPRAGETIAHLATAVRLGWTPSKLAATVHPYPTYADGPWHAALAEVYDRLAQPRTRWATDTLLGLRRWTNR
ncbi:FAD-dependent oxidoreductase [Streptomyces sp. H10-C2]|uniref:dihydrolipoyl dehydrogenase family protein n=1 Tax=unclassified Streptomyces TaxID=2593676 RepID=UPI0024BA949C|nr:MULTISPECIES: FAD-dependent oxidoreductase [unclassified Streptomyces]MDJ0346591.1 FAD-dependent oxidoreductase [Streptomyces sp. PH10-H1]MDJ0375036.1 FAD-dependent oxidoreductase [Streptomyces sp. H10-C2]